jgi:hypothetical protein
LQNQPQQNLQNYMSLVYGNPLGRVGSTTSAGAADTSTLQKVLGTAATGAAVYKNLGSPNLSWLNPFGSTPTSDYTAATNYAATSPTGWLDF